MQAFYPLITAAALLGAPLAHAADLTVDVTGLQDARGQVLVALYDRADSFLKQPLQATMVEAREGSVQVVLRNLPAGDYALSAFQDRNGNQTLDRNPVGMPIEPYGFSNDAVGDFGAPSFAQSQLHVGEAGSHTTIHLR